MIQHIVTWKLAATDDADRTAAFDAIAGALVPLADVIPGIVSLRVDRNSTGPDTNWHVALTAVYASAEDLEAYQVHPAHVAAAAIVRANVAERAAIDFEL
ncbi:MAG: Dabb family protein [Glaciihabitans sp.]|jgi:heme-degrading monooxygenase HmoA|nr:Dabb family protein [Glaciihabitans sp.]MCU1534782.1 Dabb family protein [Glaciihabitans sp.]MDQ1556391.1 hypothetical protein [Actinomycetota bacterium]